MMFFVITLLFFNGILKLHHFDIIKLYSNNTYDHKVHNSNITTSYISVLYIVIWFGTKYSLTDMSEFLNLIRLILPSGYDYGLGLRSTKHNLNSRKCPSILKKLKQIKGDNNSLSNLFLILLFNKHMFISKH